jgi:hypothetical protein
VIDQFRGKSRVGQVFLDLRCKVFVVRPSWCGHLSEKRTNRLEEANRQSGALPIRGRAKKPREFGARLDGFRATNLHNLRTNPGGILGAALCRHAIPAGRYASHFVVYCLSVHSGVVGRRIAALAFFDKITEREGVL